MPLCLLGLRARPQFCFVKWLIQRPLVSWCCWSYWCPLECLWTCFMSLPLLLVLEFQLWAVVNVPSVCALLCLLSSPGRGRSWAGLGMVLEEVVRPPGSSHGQRAVPSPKADFQADGLPPLAEKCGLKPSPLCIISGKNEEIQKIAYCGKCCVCFFCAAFPQKSCEGLESWNWCDWKRTLRSSNSAQKSSPGSSPAG